MTCAVVGIGRTTYSRNSGRTTRAMAVAACREAIADVYARAAKAGRQDPLTLGVRDCEPAERDMGALDDHGGEDGLRAEPGQGDLERRSDACFVDGRALADE